MSEKKPQLIITLTYGDVTVSAPFSGYNHDARRSMTEEEITFVVQPEVGSLTKLHDQFTYQLKMAVENEIYSRTAKPPKATQ